jgi:hypothetical protein
MPDLLIEPQQLAPTMGHHESAVRIQVGSAFLGISDTVAIGRVLYDFGFPIVPEDNLWVLARENPARIFIILIGYIYIFIGETNATAAMETNFRWIGTVKTPIRTAFELDTEEGQSDLELSKSSRLYLQVNPPTRPRGRGSGKPLRIRHGSPGIRDAAVSSCHFYTHEVEIYL